MQVNETLKNFINEAADKAFALVRESHPRAEFVKEYEAQVRCGDCFMLCSFAESAGIAIPEELRAKYEERKQRKAQAQGWAAGETKPPCARFWKRTTTRTQTWATTTRTTLKSHTAATS